MRRETFGAIDGGTYMHLLGMIGPGTVTEVMLFTI